MAGLFRSGTYRNGDGSRSAKLSATVLFTPQWRNVKLNQSLSFLIGPPTDGLKSQILSMLLTLVSLLLALKKVSPARFEREQNWPEPGAPQLSDAQAPSAHVPKNCPLNVLRPCLGTTQTRQRP